MSLSLASPQTAEHKSLPALFHLGSDPKEQESWIREREEMNEQVDHHCEKLWSMQWELLKECGKCISELSFRDIGEKHSPIDFSLTNGWGLPVGANSLALVSCSHVITSGLLSGTYAWGPEKPGTLGIRSVQNWRELVLHYPHRLGWKQTEAMR